MQPMSPLMASFVRSQQKSPYCFVKVQLPTANGQFAASQLLLPNVINAKVSLHQDHSTNTGSFTLLDPNGLYSSLNVNAPYGQAFAPGVIDNKILMYLGFQGGVYQNNGIWTPQAASLLLQFSGFVETDQQDLEPGSLMKTVNAVDLSKQFRFEVYDTFPHPLYGNQFLSYFDPAYNLYPANPDGTPIASPIVGQAYTLWGCDGKMFTSSTSDPLYGSTHIPPALYAYDPAAPGPAGSPYNGQHPINSADYIFNNATGLVTLTSYNSSTMPVYGSAILSLAGNPTYMAPEVMMRKILVEKGQWSPEFLAFDRTGIYQPMFTSNNLSAWQCLSYIATLTCPRYVPWMVRVDSNGVIHFEESNYDAPPVRTFIDEKDLFTCSEQNSSRELLTLVRADASITTGTYPNTNDQPITSIAYDLRTILRYGLTEPSVIDTNLLQNLRGLDQTQAIALLNTFTASTLGQVSRPVFSFSGDIWPDLTLEPNDIIRLKSKKTGVDTLMQITDIDFDWQADSLNETVTAEEVPLQVNYMIGLGNAVASDDAQGTTVAPPQTPLIGALRMGSGLALYPYMNNAFQIDPATQQPVIPIWDASLTPVHTHTTGAVTGSSGGPYTVPVSSVTGFSVGSWIVCDDGAHNLQGTVSSISGSSLVIAVPVNFVDPNSKPTSIVTGTQCTTNGVHFDVYLNNPAGYAPGTYQFGYKHLPPGGVGWTSYTTSTGIVRYSNQSLGPGVNPGWPPATTWYVDVGPDNVFYEYNHTPPIQSLDYSNIWNPPGNVQVPPLGGGLTSTDTGNVYLWQWFFLCLDSTAGLDENTGSGYTNGNDGKFFRLVQRINPTGSNGDTALQQVPADSGLWVYNTWADPPGQKISDQVLGTPPSGFNKIYGNMSVGVTNYPTPPIDFASVLNPFGRDTFHPDVEWGVGYGPDAGPYSYIGYEKKTRGYWCVYALSAEGTSQFVKIPFELHL